MLCLLSNDVLKFDEVECVVIIENVLVESIIDEFVVNVEIVIELGYIVKRVVLNDFMVELEKLVVV